MLGAFHTLPVVHMASMNVPFKFLDPLWGDGKGVFVPFGIVDELKFLR